MDFISEYKAKLGTPDEAAKLVRASGQEYGYISLGGSSMYVMQNPTIAADENGVRQWKVSINNPRPSEFSVSSYASVSMNDVFLSSSGDYEQYYEIGGKRYCHIINPNTGFPVNADPDSDGSGIAIVSVFGLTAAEGDATTTALMAMGKVRALEYIAENLEDKDVIFVYYDGASDSYTVYTNMEEGEYTASQKQKAVCSVGPCGLCGIGGLYCHIVHCVRLYGRPQSDRRDPLCLRRRDGLYLFLCGRFDRRGGMGKPHHGRDGRRDPYGHLFRG